MITGLPYYPLTNAGVNDAVKINADLNYLATHGMGATGIQGVTGDPGGPKGATGVAGVRGVTGLANFTEGPVMPYVLSVPHFHHHTIDDIWYTYDMDSKSWIDVSSGAKDITGPVGGKGIANFKLGELPEVPSPDQPEFFWDESDEILYFWYTGSQSWLDISTGATTQRADQNIVQNEFTGYLTWTGVQLQPESPTVITLTSKSRVMSVFYAKAKYAPLYSYTYAFYSFNGETGTEIQLIGDPGPFQTFVSDPLPAGSYTACCYSRTSWYPPQGTTGMISGGSITLIALDSGQGVQGVTGPAGAPQGVTGLVGVTGVQGVTGRTGVTGISGSPGDIFFTGIINISASYKNEAAPTGTIGYFRMPSKYWVKDWELVGDPTGWIGLTVEKSNYALFGSWTAMSLGSHPTITAGIKGTSSSAGWASPTGLADDLLKFDVVHCTGIKSWNLSMRFNRVA